MHALPFLLLATFRDDFEPQWGADAQPMCLSLKHLNDSESAAIVSKVTDGKALPADVLDQIIAKTDGVPLFIEELTKTVLESGLLVDAGDHFTSPSPLPALAIPASLQDSLMARLDRLKDVKEVAQVAATLGRRFSAELLAEVSGLNEPALEDALTQLVKAEMVYRHGLAPDMTYEFKHAMVQDVAYTSLLRSRRQQLHSQIATAIEKRAPHTVEVHPELLAYHLREGALPERAIPYAIRAGEIAAGRYASVEARTHYLSAVEMARSLPASAEAARLQIRAILKLAQVAMNRADFERDLENLEQARALAQQLDHQQRLCQIEYWIGRTNYVLGKVELAVEHAETALRMAEALGGDDQVSAGPVNLLARIYCTRGEPRKGGEYAARSVEQMHALGNRVEEAAVAGVHAFACGVHGLFAESFVAADRGVALAQQIDHLPTLAACYFYRGVVKGWSGNVESAADDFALTLDYCEQSGDLFRQYLAYGYRGEAYLIADDVERASKDLGQCLSIGDQIGTSYNRGAFQAYLAAVRLRQGDVDSALQLSEGAVKIATDTAHSWSRSIALRVHAEVLLEAKPPDLACAAELLREAIDIQGERECRGDLAWSQLASGHVALARGDAEAARRAFDAACETFRLIGLTRGLAKAEAARARLG
jgi:tetratricopeptide (TPR) repeat protein